jgi:glycerol dehydrogenase-like iron-containing ADH family enzyme
MVEKIEKVVNHRLVVFDREKFEMLKETIEKIMNDKKFKENEVVFIAFDEMKEIGKISTVLKEIRILYRVHVKGYNKGIAVSKKIEKPVNKE